MNSTLSDAFAVRRRTPENPVYMHPQDMAAMGLAPGAPVAVSRDEERRLCGPATPDPDLRRGVVAITHGWGATGPPGQPLAGLQLATNLLVDERLGVEAVNAMPVMTGVPVTVTPGDDIDTCITI
jgi:anaerobic selenocysteine-containing dehydrogenase